MDQGWAGPEEGDVAEENGSVQGVQNPKELLGVITKITDQRKVPLQTKLANEIM